MATTASAASDAQLHFLDYWRVIRIRKTVIFIVFLLVVITTTVVTYFLPKFYASTTRIAVEKDASDTQGIFEFRSVANNYDPYFIQTEFEKIQSKAVLYNVITNLHLEADWSKKYEVKLDVPRTYQILKKRIDVRQFRNTSLIEIKVLDEDPQKAVAIANEVAEAYKLHRKKSKMESATLGIRQLQEELAKQNEKVEKMQARVNQIRETNSISDAVVDGLQTSVLETETIRRLEAQRIQDGADYKQISTLFEKLKKLDKAELRNVLPRAWPDTDMSGLLEKFNTAEQQLTRLEKDYGSEHPDVKGARAVRDKVSEQLDIDAKAIMDAIEVRVSALDAKLKQTTSELDIKKRDDIRRGQIYGEYALAKKDLEMERQLRQTLSMKIMQEQTDSARSYNSIVEVIDPAERGLYPVRPNVPVNIALGVVVGLIVGIGLAFFIEYLDTSVKTIDDVERALGAPVLGVIPQNVGALMEEGPDSPHAEAYRVLRTNLLFARKNEKANTITVISGGAGEGKSTTVINLATIFAQNGQRVLVVDSDLRRPSLHKFLKISNALGLTNYLLKQKTLEEVVQTTSLASLDFLPSGKLPSSSMGILNSTRMREFIKEVRLRYDVVFFDSPPIMGVSDASILASEVDMTLLVVQYRKYPQVMTLRAKQMVEKVGGNLMGVVLNNINISQDSYYYYYSGYYYDYYSKREDGDKEDGKDSKKSGSASKTPGDLAKLDVKEK